MNLIYYYKNLFSFRNETGGPQTLWGTESVFSEYSHQQSTTSLVLPTVSMIPKSVIVHFNLMEVYLICTFFGLSLVVLYEYLLSLA